MGNNRLAASALFQVLRAAAGVCIAYPCAAQTPQLYSYVVPSIGYSPSGNVLSYTDSANGTWSMSYDSLQRIQSASSTSGPNQGLSLAWHYDSFGNRLDQTATGPRASGNGNFSAWAQYTDNTNRVTASSMAVGGLTYDASGNITNDGSNTLVYDGDGRMCAALTSKGVVQYLYDADGNRVAQLSGAALECYTGTTSPSVTASYIVGGRGEQVIEVDGSGQWQHTNIYAGGALLGTYDQAGLHFPLTDPVGTVRVWASGAGHIEDSCSSLPFGDVQTQVCTKNAADPTEHHFTGKERDTESGLDYFGARYYGSNMGRFMAPDPSNLGVDIYLPQTWNRYAYVVNNPLGLVDKNGLWPTRIHEQIIDKAFPGLTPGMRQSLKDASYNMDHKDGAQETWSAPEHAMSEGDWADDNHVQRTADFITNSENAAESALAQWSDMGAANISPVALLQFGNALHTISDDTSPSHEGGQPWDGIWHLRSAWHWAREQYIRPARMNQAVNAERAAFRKTFGDQFYFWAIGQQQPRERVTSRIVPDSIKPVDQPQ